MSPENLQLDLEILQRCVVLLRPLLRNESARRPFFQLALGLGVSVLNRLTWEGGSDSFITHAVEELFEFGTLKNDENALLVLLKYAQGEVGIDKQKRFKDLQEHIKDLLDNGEDGNFPRSGRLQDLCVLTVKIHHPVQNEVVGTGILIKGKVVTCGQVLRKAGVDPSIVGLRVSVYLSPRISGGQGRCEAEILDCASHYEDDIVVLRLMNGYFRGKSALTSSAEFSSDHKFKSYGCTGESTSPSKYVEGSISGYILPPEGIDSEVHAFELIPTDRPSNQFNSFMCGAGVLDVKHNAIVGILTQPLSNTDQRTPRAIDAYILDLQRLEDVLNQD